MRVERSELDENFIGKYQGIQFQLASVWKQRNFVLKIDTVSCCLLFSRKHIAHLNILVMCIKVNILLSVLIEIQEHRNDSNTEK